MTDDDKIDAQLEYQHLHQRINGLEAIVGKLVSWLALDLGSAAVKELLDELGKN